jgi:lipopolysaccharide export system protein LptC
MAITMNVHPAQMRLGGITAAQDRSYAFRAARRHSALVQAFKLLLPLSAFGVATLYFLPYIIPYFLPPIEVVDPKGGVGTVESIRPTSNGELRMVNPNYKGIDDKYGAYNIHADSSLQKIGSTEILNFNKIRAELVSPQGEKTVLTAPSGIFHSKQEEMTFDNGVTIDGESGMSGRLKTATAYMKEKRLISKDPVALAYQGHTIAADSMEMWSGEKRVIFTGNVKVHLERVKTEGKQQ